jgi:hypothetical protein
MFLVPADALVPRIAIPGQWLPATHSGTRSCSSLAAFFSFRAT